MSRRDGIDQPYGGRHDSDTQTTACGPADANATVSELLIELLESHVLLTGLLVELIKVSRLKRQL